MDLLTPFPDVAAPAVARLVYASVAQVQGPIYAEMERIRAAALRHNVPLGVHTALLYQSGWFLQWKEGPAEALRTLMDRVAGDPRHRGLRMVHASRGPRLLDGPWSMAIVQSADRPSEMAQRVMALADGLDDAARHAPPAIWRRLSTPMAHPGAARQADPDAFLRLMVCSTRGTASFDLVRWLAEREQQELVHRRFAGAWHRDVASDYVDFLQQERVCRVIAMARNGLEVPLTRAFLADYAYVVVLLAGDAERDRALVERIAGACAGLPEPPRLLGVSDDLQAHAHALQAAAAGGLRYCEAVADPTDPADCWDAIDCHLAGAADAANSAFPGGARFG